MRCFQICLGLTFLVKPTALITIGIPLIILFFKKYIKKVEKITFYKDIFIFIFIFIIVIFPWFSKHWITIITSTLNAWKWGINYQEGLDANTIEGWLFYLQKLPKLLV